MNDKKKYKYSSCKSHLILNFSFHNWHKNLTDNKQNKNLILKLPKAASLKISKHNIPRKEEIKPFNQYEAIARNVFHFEIFFAEVLFHWFL